MLISLVIEHFQFGRVLAIGLLLLILQTMKKMLSTLIFTTILTTQINLNSGHISILVTLENYQMHLPMYNS